MKGFQKAISVAACVALTTTVSLAPCAWATPGLLDAQQDVVASRTVIVKGASSVCFVQKATATSSIIDVSTVQGLSISEDAGVFTVACPASASYVIRVVGAGGDVFFTTIDTGASGEVLYEDTRGLGSVGTNLAFLTTSKTATTRGYVYSTVTITPGVPNLLELRSISKGFTAIWLGSPQNCTGFQLRYSTKKSMKGLKVVKISNKATTVKSVKGLSKGTRYYVQVRAFNKVGGFVRFSPWSVKKSIKISK